MSKVLITSDLHFDSFPKRNPGSDFRINQSYIVIDNLLEIAKREGAEYIFLLGDLLEKQNRDSKVHSVVKDCLEKLMTGFKKGYYILGNHDMNARSVSSESPEEDMINSYIHLYCPDTIEYMDKKVLTIDGKTFGFRNFSSADTLDLSFLDELGYPQVDYLCGHSSQYYSDEGEPAFPVQKFDSSKIRNYCFFGHIHQSVWKGKNVSIGVPQRAKITDDTPKVVILDTLTDSWKYVDADPEKKLMDLKEEISNATSDYFNESENTYYIVKKKPTENKELLKAVTNTNYDKIFEEEIKVRGLSGIFNNIKSHTPNEDLERLDLDFQIKEVRIQNWRSIKSYTQKFKPGDQFLVSGHNGAGKSSLYSAICYGLSGKCPGLLKDNVRFGEAETKVEIDLSYKGFEYTVKRGSSIIEIYKDGSLMELGNKVQRKEGILKELPFIEALDLLYYNDKNQRILGNSSASDTAKLQILYKILGLNEIDSYNKTASDIYKGLSKDFQSKHESYLVSEATLAEKRNYLNSLELRFGDISGLNPDEKLKELRGTLDKYQQLYQEKQRYDQLLRENQSIISEMSGIQVILENLNQSLSEMQSPEELQKSLADKNSELSFWETSLQKLLQSQSEYSRLTGQKEFITREGQRIKEELNSQEAEIQNQVICPTYGIACTLITEQMKRERLKSRREELEKLREQKIAEYYDVVGKIEALNYDPSRITEASERVSFLKVQVSDLQRKIFEYSQTQGKINERSKYYQSLQEKLEKIVIKPIELPGDILTRITNLSSEISTLEGYKRLLEEYSILKNNFDIQKKDYELSQKTLKGYEEFIALTKPSGIIYTKIFEIIMNSFSDNKVRYEVTVTKKNENRYINIQSYLKKTTGEVSYSGASQGERCMMDIHFLSNLKVKFGMIILDEFLGNLDQDNHDDALLKMQSLETNLLFVTSHKENLIPFPSKIEVSMTSGETKYIIG